MKTLPESGAHPQERTIEIISDALRVLKGRDGIAIPEELIAERARNAVTALEGEFDLVPKVQPIADVHAGRPSPIISMLTEYLDVRRQAQEVCRQLDAMTVTDAAVAVAALLADPFDRDARIEARLWLKAWQTTQPARPSASTTPGAAVGT
jgi:hypothetical protein